MTYVLNNYPNVYEKLSYLSIIILTVVLFVSVIRIIICVEPTRFFHCKWYSWHSILVCTNIAQFNFWRIDANDVCKRPSERPSTIMSRSGIGIGNENGVSGTTGGVRFIGNGVGRRSPGDGGRIWNHMIPRRKRRIRPRPQPSRGVWRYSPSSSQVID